MKLATLLCCVLVTAPLVSHANCRVPKSVTVCQRHCCYNYWGPGVHCTDVCTKQKLN